jgi:hypothetical protein
MSELNSNILVSGNILFEFEYTPTLHDPVGDPNKLPIIANVDKVPVLFIYTGVKVILPEYDVLKPDVPALPILALV